MKLKEGADVVFLQSWNGQHFNSHDFAVLIQIENKQFIVGFDAFCNLVSGQRNIGQSVLFIVAVMGIHDFFLFVIIF